MITIPYSIFLGIYLFIVLAILIFAFFSLYHLLRFGYRSTVNLTATFLLIAGTIFILFLSYGSLEQVSWGEVLELNVPFQSVSFLKDL